MRRPGSAATLLSLLAIAACGSGDVVDDTVPVATTGLAEDVDSRLDPDDIVITDDDGVPSSGVGVEDAATDDTAADEADGAGGDPDTAGTDPDTADPDGRDPSTGSSAGDAGGSSEDASTGPDDPGFTTAEEIPDDWPADVPSPTGLTEIAATVFEDSIEYTIVVTGRPATDPTAYVAGYLDEARAAGFETTSVIEDTSQVYSFVAERDGWFLSAASTAVGGVDEVVVALTRNR